MTEDDASVRTDEDVTTWRKLLSAHMQDCGENEARVVAWAAEVRVDGERRVMVCLDAASSRLDGSDTWLDTEFYAGWGGANGCPFTVWTAARVYFPVVYDGREWVGSVPRNPGPEATMHQGGE